MRTAVRYKVDASKITAGVPAELSAKRKECKAQSRNRQKTMQRKRLNARQGCDSF